MKTCPQCGKQLEDDARFCSQCGAPQTGATATTLARNGAIAQGEHATALGARAQASASPW